MEIESILRVLISAGFGSRYMYYSDSKVVTCIIDSEHVFEVHIAALVVRTLLVQAPHCCIGSSCTANIGSALLHCMVVHVQL